MVGKNGKKGYKCFLFPCQSCEKHIDIWEKQKACQMWRNIFILHENSNFSPEQMFAYEFFEIENVFNFKLNKFTLYFKNKNCLNGIQDYGYWTTYNGWI